MRERAKLSDGWRYPDEADDYPNNSDRAEMEVEYCMRKASK